MEDSVPCASCKEEVLDIKQWKCCICRKARFCERCYNDLEYGCCPESAYCGEDRCCEDCKDKKRYCLDDECECEAGPPKGQTKKQLRVQRFKDRYNFLKTKGN